LPLPMRPKTVSTPSAASVAPTTWLTEGSGTGAAYGLCVRLSGGHGMMEA
jgi:hypothetical protein